MVGIRLLGTLRRAAGTSQLSVDRTDLTVRQLLELVEARLTQPLEYRLDSSNTLVLVNGVEISALQHMETIVPDGGEVVLIPVVHGGIRGVPLGDETTAGVLFCGRGNVREPAGFLAAVRKHLPDCLVQAFDAQSVGGPEHLIAVARQAWEAQRRGQTFSRSVELDLLLRVAAKRQIQGALARVGLRPSAQRVAVVVIGPRHQIAGLSCKDLGLPERADSTTRAGSKTTRERLSTTERRSAVGADAEALLLAEQGALLVG